MWNILDTVKIVSPIIAVKLVDFYGSVQAAGFVIPIIASMQQLTIAS